ncbi:MAG: hypothetical protein FWG81_09010 [Betaproteobacteria bacterium]|nr:hypothetical protein [Betaproteobacteria bacterium]
MSKLVAFSSYTLTRAGAVILISLALLTPFSVLAEEEVVPTPLLGVWRTIGGPSIVACFNNFNKNNASQSIPGGYFYYIVDRDPIMLSPKIPDTKAGVYYRYRDTQSGKTWELSTPVDGVITGTWRSGGVNHTINLTLVDGDDDELACERDSFNSLLRSPLGVWRGTIGTETVVACFNKGDQRTPHGFYFYTAYLKPENLVIRNEYKNDNSYGYDEQSKYGKLRVRWELSASDNGVMVGTWRDENTEKALPIYLTLVDGDDDKFACNRDSFRSPLTQRRGVWSGTIGTKAIIACFNGSPDGYRGKINFDGWPSGGSYYYIADLKHRRLSRGRHDNSDWHSDSYWDTEEYWKAHISDTERGNTAEQWSLSAPANGIMEGTWQDEKTKEPLPIRLSLVDGNYDNMACARDSYNLRLEEAISKVIEKGETIQFSPGRSYRGLRFIGQGTIELLGSDPGLDRINSALEAFLTSAILGHDPELDQINSQIKSDQRKEALKQYFQRRRQSLGASGYIDPGMLVTAGPVKYWDSNFVNIQFDAWWPYGESCSTAPQTWHRAWNVKTGEEVNFWQWFEGNSSDDNYSRLPLELKKFLYKSEEPPEYSYFTITLGKNGLHIDEVEEPGMGDAPKSFIVPYKELLPFLNSDGKKAVNSILKRK